MTARLGRNAEIASGLASNPTAGLERNIVVHRRIGVARGATTAIIRATRRLAARIATAATAATARSDEVHGVGVDLGRVSLVSVFVFPLPGLNSTFDVDSPSLREILIAHLGSPAPDDDAMPLCAFDAFTAFVGPCLARREREVDDGLAIRRCSQLGVTAEIAYKDGFIDTCHGGAPKGLVVRN
jgi:hypothetical protein